MATTLTTFFDYRDLEKAGFTKEQTDALKSAIEASSQHDEAIKREIAAAESRLEKAFIREISELRKEMYASTEKILERVHKVEINLSFINRIGGFVLAIASLAAVFVSVFHAHISFN